MSNYIDHRKRPLKADEKLDARNNQTDELTEATRTCLGRGNLLRSKAGPRIRVREFMYDLAKRLKFGVAKC